MGHGGCAPPPPASCGGPPSAASCCRMDDMACMGGRDWPGTVRAAASSERSCRMTRTARKPMVVTTPERTAACSTHPCMHAWRTACRRCTVHRRWHGVAWHGHGHMVAGNQRTGRMHACTQRDGSAHAASYDIILNRMRGACQHLHLWVRCHACSCVHARRGRHICRGPPVRPLALNTPPAAAGQGHQAKQRAPVPCMAARMPGTMHGCTHACTHGCRRLTICAAVGLRWKAACSTRPAPAAPDCTSAGPSSLAVWKLTGSCTAPGS